MLTRGEDVEVYALRKRGWSYAAIARHLDRDWRTIKGYIDGDREPGVRRRLAPDPLERFVPYLQARFVDDPHVWASALFDEVVALGYDRSYPHFVRQVRQRALRPHCEACWGVKGRDVADIEHPPGDELLCGKPHRPPHRAGRRYRWSPGPSPRRKPRSGAGAAGHGADG
jgi:hypothetical protein